MGKDPAQVNIVHYAPKQFDFGKGKAFPLRSQHFFADIRKAQTQLDWTPKFDLVAGLKDSYEHDFLAHGQDKTEVDFSLDDMILSSTP
jgi:nucleoside-diphosphate-sugar epimerase